VLALIDVITTIICCEKLSSADVAFVMDRLLVIFLCGLMVVVVAEEVVAVVDTGVGCMVGLMEAGELATVGHVAQDGQQLPSID
jgi:hypothetical protein